MKNKFYVFAYLATVFSLPFLQGQTSAKVKYEFNAFGNFQFETTLVIDNSKSWYSHIQDSKEWLKDGYELKSKKEHYDWYLDLSKNRIVEICDREGYPLLYSTHEASMKWDILEETSVVNGYKVQKAMRKALINDQFHGDVIAWFTTDLPFSTGPERYYGLPGLILKIEYTGIKSIYVTLKSIEFDTSEKIIIPKKKGIEVSLEEIVNPGTINRKWLKEQKKLID